MLKQVLLQLDILHRVLNVIHGDIKSANILKSGSKISIADFGSAQKFDVPFTYCGTRLYLPPEYFLPEKFDHKRDSFFYCAGDIWSLGVTLLELVLGEHPFKDMEESTTPITYHLIDLFGNQENLLNKLLSSFKLLPSISEEFLSFILLCLKWDPKKRPTAQQLLDSPFMSNLVFSSHLSHSSLPPCQNSR